MPKDTFFNLPEKKRARLRDALLDAFAENDYKNVSVSQIVAAAGIPKGSFYQYFEDKADSYLYLIDLAMAEKMAFMRQVESSPPPQDLFDNLRWMLDVGVGFEFSNPRLTQVSYRAVFGDVPLPDETLAVIREGGMAYFRQMVEEGIQAGTIREGVDPETAAFLFNVIFTNLGQYLIQREQIDALDLKKDGAGVFAQDRIKIIMNQVIDILELGLRASS